MRSIRTAQLTGNDEEEAEDERHGRDQQALAGGSKQAHRTEERGRHFLSRTHHMLVAKTHCTLYDTEVRTSGLMLPKFSIKRMPSSPAL